MIERRIPQAVIEEAYRRFLNSDRGRQAGFDLAKRVFGIGDEESAKDAEE